MSSSEDGNTVSISGGSHAFDLGYADTPLGYLKMSVQASATVTTTAQERIATVPPSVHLIPDRSGHGVGTLTVSTPGVSIKDRGLFGLAQQNISKSAFQQPKAEITQSPVAESFTIEPYHAEVAVKGQLAAATIHDVDFTVSTEIVNGNESVECETSTTQTVLIDSRPVTVDYAVTFTIEHVPRPKNPRPPLAVLEVATAVGIVGTTVFAVAIARAMGWGSPPLAAILGSSRRG